MVIFFFFHSALHGLYFVVLVFEETVEDCEEIVVKVGCYKNYTRPLPKILLNERKNIDWQDWENFIKRYATPYPRKTKPLNSFTYFLIGDCCLLFTPDILLDIFLS